VDFKDTQFVSAPAPFWFGDVLPGGTQITGMQNVYGSIFLRRSFVVSNPSDVASLRMGALVDDGFVAWINGSEVLRVNVPGSPGDAVGLSSLADNAAEPVAFTEYALPDGVQHLKAGTNVLAVQVFQSSLGSSDLGFDASLQAVPKDSHGTQVKKARLGRSSSQFEKLSKWYRSIIRLSSLGIYLYKYQIYFIPRWT
jgi:hypothetical protein